jgi:hypothetical protein
MTVAARRRAAVGKAAGESGPADDDDADSNDPNRVEA